MATISVTLTNSAWTQVSSSDVYVKNQDSNGVIWRADATTPASDAGGYVLSSGEDLTIALSQPIWAKSSDASAILTVTEF